jgi:hypothetical protein
METLPDSGALPLSRGGPPPPGGGGGDGQIEGLAARSCSISDEPNATPVECDAALIACDAIAECAQALILQSAGLLAVASAGDIPAVEARLWALRRALTEAIRCWRIVVPSLESGRAA